MDSRDNNNIRDNVNEPQIGISDKAMDYPSQDYQESVADRDYYNYDAVNYGYDDWRQRGQRRGLKWTSLIAGALLATVGSYLVYRKTRAQRERTRNLRTPAGRRMGRRSDIGNSPEFLRDEEGRE